MSIKYHDVTVGVTLSGSGTITPSLLYTLGLDQGGVWVDTQLDISGYDSLLFASKYNGTVVEWCQVPKSIIPVSSYSYLSLFTVDGKVFNVQIRGTTLFVSFNNSGSNSYAVSVYEPIDPNINWS